MSTTNSAATMGASKPGRRLNREESKAATRVALLEAARRCVARHGYQASSLDLIAEEAGYTKGAVYVHFASKQALLLEVLGIGLRRQVGELAGFAEQAQRDPKGFAREFDAWLDTLDAGEDIPQIGLELQIEARRNPAMRPAFEEMLDDHRRALARALESMIAATGVKAQAPPEQLANTIIAIAEGIALTRVTTPQAPVASTGDVVRLLLNFRAPPPG